MTLDSIPAPRPLARFLLAAAGLASLMPSCGGSGGTVPLHPATGQVLYLGKPLESYQVTFLPAAAEAAVSVAETDADGKFRLSTPVGESGALNPGIPAGEYRVGINPPRRSDSKSFLNTEKKSFAIDPLKGRYANPTTSGLKASIKPGENTLEPFNLTETGGASQFLSPGGRDR